MYPSASLAIFALTIFVYSFLDFDHLDPLRKIRSGEVDSYRIRRRNSFR